MHSYTYIHACIHILNFRDQKTLPCSNIAWLLYVGYFQVHDQTPLLKWKKPLNKDILVLPVPPAAQ